MSSFKQTGGPGPGHGPAPAPPRVAPDKKPGPEGGLTSFIVSAIMSVILIAGIGFFTHMWVDIFDWAWDLWGSLVD